MDEFADKKVIGQPVFADFGNQGDNFFVNFFSGKNELISHFSCAVVFLSSPYLGFRFYH